jgi:Winged helix DNA-binding domain
MAGLDLTRAEILAFRRRATALDARLRPGRRALRTAAWAGLQDSMPRAAILSIHARVERTPPTILDDDYLVQVWGPRYSVFVVAARDLAVFTLGRMPLAAKRRERAETMAHLVDSVLQGKTMREGEVGKALGINPNAIKYAAPTGRLLIHWDGARQSEVWAVPPPAMGEAEARLELARRYLHVFGPSTPESYASWAGISRGVADQTFGALRGELLQATTPLGEAWALAEDEEGLRSDSPADSAVRLLPSGDTYFLLGAEQRTLLVPDEVKRASLWPSRVWPGAVLLGGEIVGTWRRSRDLVTIDPWRALSASEVGEIEGEATALPLPGLNHPIEVSWNR